MSALTLFGAACVIIVGGLSVAAYLVGVPVLAILAADLLVVGATYAVASDRKRQ